MNFSDLTKLKRRGNDVRNNDTWIKIAEDQRSWKQMESEIAMTVRQHHMEFGDIAEVEQIGMKDHLKVHERYIAHVHYATPSRSTFAGTTFASPMNRATRWTIRARRSNQSRKIIRMD